MLSNSIKKELDSLDKINKFLDDAISSKVSIGVFGGRTFKYSKGSEFKMNDLVKHVLKEADKKSFSPDEIKDLKSKLFAINQVGDKKLDDYRKDKNCFKRIRAALTEFKQKILKTQKYRTVQELKPIEKPVIPDKKPVVKENPVASKKTVEPAAKHVVEDKPKARSAPNKKSQYPLPVFDQKQVQNKPKVHSSPQEKSIQCSGARVAHYKHKALNPVAFIPQNHRGNPTVLWVLDHAFMDTSTLFGKGYLNKSPVDLTQDQLNKLKSKIEEVSNHAAGLPSDPMPKAYANEKIKEFETILGFTRNADTHPYGSMD